MKTPEYHDRVRAAGFDGGGYPVCDDDHVRHGAQTEDPRLPLDDLGDRVVNGPAGELAVDHRTADAVRLEISGNVGDADRRVIRRVVALPRHLSRGIDEQDTIVHSCGPL